MKNYNKWNHFDDDKIFVNLVSYSLYNIKDHICICRLAADISDVQLECVEHVSAQPVVYPSLWDERTVSGCRAAANTGAVSPVWTALPSQSLVEGLSEPLIQVFFYSLVII